MSLRCLLGLHRWIDARTGMRLPDLAFGHIVIPAKCLRCGVLATADYDRPADIA